MVDSDNYKQQTIDGRVSKMDSGGASNRQALKYNGPKGVIQKV
jgi:hypothetical protein